MNPDLFMILDYSTNRIIPGLTVDAVCVTARVLYHLPTPSFDIFDDRKRCVTGHFSQSEAGHWVYMNWERPAEAHIERLD